MTMDALSLCLLVEPSGPECGCSWEWQRGQDMMPKFSPLHSKLTPLFGIIRRPWPKSSLLQLVGLLIQLEASQINKHQTPTHNFPSRHRPHSPLFGVLPSLSLIAWQPQALNTAISSQEPPSMFQMLCSGLHSLGPMAPTCIQEITNLAGLSSLPLQQPLIVLLPLHPLPCIPPKFIC